LSKQINAEANGGSEQVSGEVDEDEEEVEPVRRRRGAA